jgi:hypothetical protein
VPEEQARNILAAIEKDYENVVQGYWNHSPTINLNTVRDVCCALQAQIDMPIATLFLDPRWTFCAFWHRLCADLHPRISHARFH